MVYRVVLTMGTLFALLLTTVGGTGVRPSFTSSDIDSYRSKFDNYEFDLQEEARFHLQEGITLLKGTDMDKSSRHEVVFAVQQNNLDRLTDILMDVSAPSSPNYGKHWTRAQIAALTSNPLAASAVTTFLKTHDLHVVAISRYQDYITASGTLAQWEVFFRTEFHVFHDQRHDQFFLRALEHSLPRPLQQHIMGVFGVSDYFLDLRESMDDSLSGAMPGDINQISLAKAFAASNQQPTPDGQPWCQNHTNAVGELLFTVCVTYPQLLYAVYDVVDPVGSPLVSQAIFGALDQSLSPADLQQFQRGLNLTIEPLAGAYHGHVDDNACYQNIGACAEASLDVQYIMAMAQRVPTYYDYVTQDAQDAQDAQNLFVTWILEVADMDHPADVFSIGYMSTELHQSLATLTTFNVEAQKLGLAGVTIVTASGDDGAPGRAALQNVTACAYAPMFPSVSPFVTSVGGTQGPEAGEEEVACQVPSASITSGGGFSAYPTINTLPAYQQRATAQYLAHQGPVLVAGYGTGRGYPDLSLLSNNYVVVVNGSVQFVAGTSASASVLAGVISLANSIRKEAGMPTLGFVNPFLYAAAQTFVHDLTVGNNGCTRAYAALAVDATLQYVGTCCLQRYFATTGWDPITGLGSVDVARFLQAVRHTSSSSSSASFWSAGAVAGVVLGGLLCFVGGLWTLYWVCYQKTQQPSWSARADLVRNVDIEYTAL